MKCPICGREFDHSDLVQVLNPEHSVPPLEGKMRGRLTGKIYRKEESVNISEIKYHHEDISMDVHYRNGNSYRYFDVPSLLFRQAVESEAIGAFLSKNVKGVYRYTRL